jgi:hypothetical protein
MKICPKCKKELSLSEFYNCKRDGTQSKCKKCKLQNNAESRAKHRQANKESVFWAKRKMEYGITKEEFLKMKEEQNNLCAICKKPESRKRNNEIVSLCIDHNHETGYIRALLCSSCNSGIGYFKENIEVIKSAIKYLERYNNASHG